MYLLATEVNWPLAFNTFVIALGFILQWASSKKEAKKAAIAVEAVKNKLAVTEVATTKHLNEQTNQLTTIHTLVNNNMAIQLRLNRELSQWKASQTNDPQDVEAAQLSVKLYAEHVTKQRLIDDSFQRNPV